MRLRFLNLIRRGLGWKKLALTDVSVVTFRVWPQDIDINLHLTNSRYLAFMDLGRTDLLLRSGLWRLMRRGRKGIVVGGAAIRYRHSLAPFERFSLATRLLGWDARWIYTEQVFTGAQGVVACKAVTRSAFTENGKMVPPDTVLAAAAPPAAALVLPAWVEQWMAAESAFAAS